MRHQGKVDKFVCLIIILVLSCTKLMRDVLKSNFSGWTGNDDANSDRCRDIISKVGHLCTFIEMFVSSTVIVIVT